MCLDLVPSVAEAAQRQQWSCQRVVEVAHAAAVNASVAKAKDQPERQQVGHKSLNMSIHTCESCCWQEHVRLSELKAAADHIELLSEASTHDFDNLSVELGVSFAAFATVHGLLLR
eukprot:TRINITY_DN12333_c9_g1_i5.p6 TRINITY_DN12333_c9_g1~~TRINITY_DN12333_c9_g1_i5.p6  ORF type:complete len:116 (+),score=27.54 TRINITY_DN12333_c9_g1_i5:1216-1563(+)